MQGHMISLWFLVKKIENFSTWKEKTQNPYKNQAFK
jgi:hypothetical protein